jgi:hypothetical protein
VLHVGNKIDLMRVTHKAGTAEHHCRLDTPVNPCLRPMASLTIDELYSCLSLVVNDGLPHNAKLAVATSHDKAAESKTIPKVCRREAEPDKPQNNAKRPCVATHRGFTWTFTFTTISIKRMHADSSDDKYRGAPPVSTNNQARHLCKHVVS